MTLLAHRCPNDHYTYPAHRRCPTCGCRQVDSVDLSDRTAKIVTWTTNTATPPGISAPNTIAIVEFTIDSEIIRVIGGLTTADVAIGDTVKPLYVPELRDPDAGIRARESQSWDGYRFEPV